jgi:hypothetical protein
VRPTGNNVLVEILTEQEVMGTRLTVNTRQRQPGRDEAFQAYVLAVGPSVKKNDWGFDVGDRVVLSGMAVPLPKYGPNPQEARDRVMVEPHTIRGVVNDNLIEIEGG